MSRFVITLALAVSLAFNVFFTLGVIKARSGRAAAFTDPAAESATVEQVSAQLSLDESQQALFSHMRRSVLEDRADTVRATSLIREEILEELQQERPDLERIRALVLRGVDSERRHRAFAAAQFSEFVGVLRPPQRDRLRGAPPEGGMHGPPHGPPPPGGARRAPRGDRADRSDSPEALLRQFDRDGDGVLTASEREEAERFLDARRRDREARRAEMMRRFDADGDGHLSEEELSAMRAWLSEQRRLQGGGDGVRPPRPHRLDQGDRLDGPDQPVPPDPRDAPPDRDHRRGR